MSETTLFSPEGVDDSFSFQIGENKFGFKGGLTEGKFSGMIRGADGQEFAGLVEDLGGGRYKVEDWESGRMFEPSNEQPTPAMADVQVGFDDAAVVAAMDEVPAEATTVEPQPEQAEAAPAEAVAELPLPAEPEPVAAEEPAAEAVQPPALEPAPEPEIVPEPITEEPVPVPENQSTVLETEQALQIIENVRTEIQKIVEASRSGQEIVPVEIPEVTLKVLGNFDQETSRLFDTRNRELERMREVLNVGANDKMLDELASDEKYAPYAQLRTHALRVKHDSLVAEIAAITEERRNRKQELAGSLGITLDENGHVVQQKPLRQETNEVFSPKRIAGYHEAVDEEAAVAEENLKRWEGYLRGNNVSEPVDVAKDFEFTDQIKAFDSQMQEILARAKPARGKKGEFILAKKDQAQYDELRKAQQRLRAERTKAQRKTKEMKPVELQNGQIIWGEVTLGKGKKKTVRTMTSPRTEIGMIYQDAIQKIMTGAAPAEIPVSPMPESEPEPAPDQILPQEQVVTGPVVETTAEPVIEGSAESVVQVTPQPEPEPAAAVMEESPAEVTVPPIVQEETVPPEPVEEPVEGSVQEGQGQVVVDAAEQARVAGMPVEAPVEAAPDSSSDAEVPEWLVSPATAPMPEGSAASTGAPVMAPAEASAQPEVAGETPEQRSERRKHGFAGALAELDVARNNTSGTEGEQKVRLAEAYNQAIGAAMELMEEGAAAKEVVKGFFAGALGTPGGRKLTEVAVRSRMDEAGVTGAPVGEKKKKLEQAGLLGLIELLLELGMNFSDKTIGAVITEVQSATGGEK